MSKWFDRSGETLRWHTLPRSVFTEICAGAVTSGTIDLMRTTQYSRRKLQLRALAGLANDNPTAVGPLTGVDEVWQLLATIESHAPEIVEEVLMYPPVGAWLSRMVHRLATNESAITPLWTEFGYLHSAVAAAAIRADIPVSIDVPVHHGAVNLPTVGRVRLPVTFPIGMARLVADRRDMRLHGPSFDMALPVDLTEPTSHYQPTRTHVSDDRGLVLRLRIEDTDPYRAFTAPQRPVRLTPIDAADWDKLIDETWHVLSASHSDYAEEISAGLTTITPATAEDNLLAASSPSSFGGMVLSAGESSITMAELVVHELQHSKLNALLDLVALLDQPSTATEYAPWREDPRPPIGLLHGIYAFASAVEFHRAQRADTTPTEAERSDFLFAYRRAQVREAITVARGFAGLTELGRKFVEIVAGRMAVCDRDAVNDEVLNTVAAMTADHRATWRMRHHRVEPEWVDRLWAAWSRGGPSPRITSRGWTVQADHRRVPASRRESMTRLRLLDPEAFTRMVRQQNRAAIGPTDADVAYTTGDHTRAAATYSARLSQNARDWQSWIGLGLCAVAQRDGEAARGLLHLPAAVVTLYDHIRRHARTAADPIAVARWVGRSG